VRVSERGEEALPELPGEFRSLWGELPSLSMVVTGDLDKVNFQHRGRPILAHLSLKKGRLRRDAPTN
jgi:hypothetical protein